MNAPELLALLDTVQSGTVAPAEARERILQWVRQVPFEDLGFARIDHHREVRQGFPEVIFAPGKTPDQVARIAERIVARGRPLLITRATLEIYDTVQALVPDAVHHPNARVISRRHSGVPSGIGTVLIASGGTADGPVAEEAAVTCEVMGNTVDRLYDVGVAGIHRLLAEHERLASARVVIVVAGMEGALPSVIGGLVQVPVIAVPTSVGYGASFGGLAALLAMLNTCSTGVGVVNIDNGFGAAALASRINHL